MVVFMGFKDFKKAFFFYFSPSLPKKGRILKIKFYSPSVKTEWK